MSDSTETPGLAEARKALAESEAPRCAEWCGTRGFNDDLLCGLAAGHSGPCDPDADANVYPEHLTAALADVDRLTAENGQLREALATLTHAAADIVSSDPDMPSHAEADDAYERANADARRVLAFLRAAEVFDG